MNVLITILDDDVVEQKENFFAMLSTIDRNVQVCSGTATIMIEDDDASVERCMFKCLFGNISRIYIFD